MFFTCKDKDGLEFVLYDEKNFTVDELKKDFGINCEIEITNEPDKNLLFVSLDDLILTNLGQFKRTRLHKINANSFNELEAEYNLIQQKKSNKSANIRRLIEQRYCEIVKLLNV